MLFPREIGLKRSKCATKLDFDKYVQNMWNKTSCYTSLYSFGGMKWNGYRQVFDYNTAIIDRAWWDFDGMDDPQVKEDAATLINRLDGTVLAVATGRGFHIHQIFKEPVREDRWPTELVRYERQMADGLTTLDCIGTVDRLCRIPDTINPKRRRFCVVIDARKFASNPLAYKIPKNPDATLTHLNPFEGHTSDFSLVKKKNDNPPELETITYESKMGDIVGAETVPIMPCLDSIYTNNPTHHVRVALAQHLLENLKNFAHPSTLTAEQKQNCVEEAIEFIRPLGWRDFQERISRKHLASIVEYEGSQSCRWFVGKGMCKGKCWRYDGTVNL